MDRDDIIRMSKEAGEEEIFVFSDEWLERFAALVAAAEREECARIAEEFGDPRDGIERVIRARSNRGEQS